MDKRNIKFVLSIELQHINIPEEELVIIIGNLLDISKNVFGKTELVTKM